MRVTRAPTLDDALALAMSAHREQRDKGGRPYIEHVQRVVAALDGEREKMVGALHDVIEDSGYTLAQVRRLGYAREIVQALDCLTRRPGEPYDSYLRRVSRNALARRVKLADLRDNMDMSRLETPTEKDWLRYQKYTRAWRFLTGGASLPPEPRLRESFVISPL